MKKIITILLISIFSFSLVFGSYTPTAKDEKKLNSIYKTLDKIIEKQPSKAEKLLKKINQIKEKVKNEKTKYLIAEIAFYLEENLNKENTDEIYKVISVSDGDTIKIDYKGEKKTIRFIGVDTPESYETRFGYKECYGDEASNYLKDLLENKSVQLETDDTQGKTDKYGRLLGYVIYDGENINGKLIQEGYGWEYTYNKPYKYQKEFKEYQESAKNSKKGLWAENTCNGERKKHFSIEEETQNEVENIINQDSNYSCTAKRYCSQMTTCEEAKYYLNSCNLYKLDKDGDGVPCESLCQ